MGDHSSYRSPARANVALKRAHEAARSGAPAHHEYFFCRGDLDVRCRRRPTRWGTALRQSRHVGVRGGGWLSLIKAYKQCSMVMRKMMPQLGLRARRAAELLAMCLSEHLRTSEEVAFDEAMISSTRPSRWPRAGRGGPRSRR